MKRAALYPASEIDDDTKSKLAKLFKIQKAKGKSNKEFTAECAEAGWVFSERVLDRWLVAINSGSNAISVDKMTGSPPSLTRPERDISSGWVLDQLDHGKLVNLDSFCKFVLSHFSIKIATSTASNYLSEDGFTYRVVKKRSSSYIVDLEKLEADLWNWVSRRQISLNNIAPSKVCSIDFTFTGHRTERRMSFGVEGNAQPTEAVSISRYTNCIVTCAWADGRNRTPPVLFTFNQEFRRDRTSTARRAEQVEHLRERLSYYGINKHRVIYIGKDKGEKETYVKESPDLLRRFFKLYNLPADATALSDNGNSFFENGESVLKKLGFKNHDCYPSNVHQWISINDNPWHGSSKGSWRTSGVDYSDDVDSCLMLLSLLDKDIIENGKYWFQRNILALKESEVGALIGNRGSKKSHLHKSWLRAYRISIHQDARGERPNIPEEIRDGLDGLYWDDSQ
jgi:hypothetical protein